MTDHMQQLSEQILDLQEELLEAQQREIQYRDTIASLTELIEHLRIQAIRWRAVGD
jgi:DNA repair exonuclease SbcCD ATPase subunit